VLQVVDRLTPATAQRVARQSLQERFMWTVGVNGWLRELRKWLLPFSAGLWKAYRRRFGMLAGGAVSR
jgi:hypothetical protein